MAFFCRSRDGLIWEKQILPYLVDVLTCVWLKRHKSFIGVPAWGFLSSAVSFFRLLWVPFSPRSLGHRSSHASQRDFDDLNIRECSISNLFLFNSFGGLFFLWDNFVDFIFFIFWTGMKMFCVFFFWGGR